MINNYSEKILIDYFLAQEEFWKMHVEHKEYGYELTSDIVKDYEYNFIYIFEQDFCKYLDELINSKKIDKNKAIYILNKNFDLGGFKQVFDDFWFFRYKKTSNNYEIETLSDIVFKKIGNESKQDMIEIFNKAYINKNCGNKYSKLLKHLNNINLDHIEKNSGYKINPYIAYKKTNQFQCV